MRILAIIPAYNEEANIQAVAIKAFKEANALAQKVYLSAHPAFPLHACP